MSCWIDLSSNLLSCFIFNNGFSINSVQYSKQSIFFLLSYAFHFCVLSEYMLFSVVDVLVSSYMYCRQSVSIPLHRNISIHIRKQLPISTVQDRTTRCLTTSSKYAYLTFHIELINSMSKDRCYII